MAGFTCYLWNIDRTLWVADRIKQTRPEVLVAVGGPEITSDNDWVLEHPAVDYAVIGEGEQTFAELLAALASQPIGGKENGSVGNALAVAPPGLWARNNPVTPARRVPLRNLDEISSPYLEEILAADERTMFLETVRGCVFKCKFCYYPKSYDAHPFRLPREDRGQSPLRAPQRRARNRPLGSHAQPTAGFCRLPPPPGRTQSRSAIHLFR